MKKIFKNARIVDKFNDFIGCVLIEEGKIVEVGENIEGNFEEEIDVQGKILTPSFIDLHAHFRFPGYTYKEDLLSGSMAALKGGYSTVCLMANTKPKVDNIETYNTVMDKAKEIDYVDLVQLVAVTKNFDGVTMINYDEFPLDVKLISDDGTGIDTTKSMYDALNNAKKYNKTICIHAEDSSMSNIDYRIAEDVMTIRDVYLAKQTGARIHMCHVSTKDSIEAVRWGKSMGANVTCEITPHHISLWDSDYRVNPPIRKKYDVESLIEAIKDSTVDCIATDHAPHSVEDKKAGSPGMVGLEIAFSLCNTNLCKKYGISLSKLSELMSYNPAKILEQDNKKGLIKESYNADFIVVDDEKEIVVTEDLFKSKSKNSPFIGHKLKGEVLKVYKDGELKYDNR